MKPATSHSSPASVTMATAISVAHDQRPACIAPAGDSVLSSETPSPRADGWAAICGNAAGVDALGTGSTGPPAESGGGTAAEAPGRSGAIGAIGMIGAPWACAAPGACDGCGVGGAPGAPAPPGAPAEVLGAGLAGVGRACCAAPFDGEPAEAAARTAGTSASDGWADGDSAGGELSGRVWTSGDSTAGDSTAGD